MLVWRPPPPAVLPEPGIKKTHVLGYEDCEIYQAVFRKELSPNRCAHAPPSRVSCTTTTTTPLPPPPAPVAAGHLSRFLRVHRPLLVTTWLPPSAHVPAVWV